MLTLNTYQYNHSMFKEKSQNSEIKKKDVIHMVICSPRAITFSFSSNREISVKTPLLYISSDLNINEQA